MALYELNENLKLDFLIGLTLTQISVGEYQLQLGFNGRANISVGESISCVTPASKSRWHPNEQWVRFPERADMRAVVDLLGFLGKTTTAFRRNGEYGLSLVFDNGFELEIHGEESKYESYQIGHADHNGNRGGYIIV